MGGYDDWLQQSAGETAASTAVDRAAPEKGRPQKERARKLSFKEVRELEALPGQIAGLEEEQAGLHARLSDPEFSTAPGEVTTINARLAAIDVELEAAYLRWDGLESLRNPA